jgi:hypothetical protein
MQGRDLPLMNELHNDDYERARECSMHCCPLLAISKFRAYQPLAVLVCVTILDRTSNTGRACT